MKLATGNETLVQAENSVLISNKKMENTFGGDSILILLESKDTKELLSLVNITKLYTIEQELSFEEHIFSIVSPATVVHQITTKQSVEITKQVKVIASGLSEMGTNMTTLGNELLTKDIKDPTVILTKLNNLTSMTSTFGQLISAQNSMSSGAAQIGSGLSTVADGLLSLSQQLTYLATSQPASSLQTTLNAMAANLSVTSNGVKIIGNNSGNLQTGASNTAEALTNISNKLATELTSMKDGLDQGLTPDQLRSMANNFVMLGDKLQKISEGLTLFGTKSSMMVPLLPTLKDELNGMIYDANGVMRSAFSEVVLNDHQALMVIRLAGNLEDTEKDRITANIAKIIEKAEFTELTTTMSGKTVLDAALRTEMKSSMMMMIGLAVLVRCLGYCCWCLK